MNKDLFREYLDLQKNIDELMERKSELSAQMFTEMRDNDVDNVKTDTGTFYIKTTGRYSFSGNVKEKEKEIKKKLDEMKEHLYQPIEDLKQEEIENGNAKYSETSAVIFRKVSAKTEE